MQIHSDSFREDQCRSWKYQIRCKEYKRINKFLNVSKVSGGAQFQVFLLLYMQFTSKIKNGCLKF